MHWTADHSRVGALSVRTLRSMLPSTPCSAALVRPPQRWSSRYRSRPGIVERFACDCSLTRVLVDSDSMVIDVGREKRILTGSRRRALVARDKHCRWPGCDRPASWTNAHHLVHWIHGGTSDLDNQVLLCYRHHWMVHEGGWQVMNAEDGNLIAIPPTYAIDSWTRGPGMSEAG